MSMIDMNDDVSRAGIDQVSFNYIFRTRETLMQKKN